MHVVNTCNLSLPSTIPFSSCSDEEKVEVVCVAADNIRKLSTQLIDCANIVARETKEHKGECSPVTQENSELLRRNWSSQVGLKCTKYHLGS